MAGRVATLVALACLTAAAVLARQTWAVIALTIVMDVLILYDIRERFGPQKEQPAWRIKRHVTKKLHSRR
jgi:hypothetical protein